MKQIAIYPIKYLSQSSKKIYVLNLQRLSQQKLATKK